MSCGSKRGGTSSIHLQSIKGSELPLISGSRFVSLIFFTAKMGISSSYCFDLSSCLDACITSGTLILEENDRKCLYTSVIQIKQSELLNLLYVHFSLFTRFFFLFNCTNVDRVNKYKYGDINTARRNREEESQPHRKTVISGMWFNLEAMGVYRVGGQLTSCTINLNIPRNDLVNSSV